MTRIKAGDTLWRETLSVRDGRSIVVGVRACTLAFRLKGMRTVYELPVNMAYWQAVKLRAAELIVARREKRAKDRRRAR